MEKKKNYRYENPTIEEEKVATWSDNIDLVGGLKFKATYEVRRETEA